MQHKEIKHQPVLTTQNRNRSAKALDIGLGDSNYKITLYTIFQNRKDSLNIFVRIRKQ